MTHRVRRCYDPQIPQALHMLTFPHDDWEEPELENRYWVAWDETGTPVGFASARIITDTTSGDIAYLTRAGVLPLANGAGLQRRFIKARCDWARRKGMSHAVTYTVLKNYPSICNLLKCGFRFYHPADPWVGNEVHYFIKDLQCTK